jgi:predicted site-specific integrase-resolvase
VSNPSQYLTIAEAVSRLADRGVKVTGQTVRRWTKSGKVRCVRLKSGQQIYVYPEDIDAMLEPSNAGGAA